MIYYLFLDDVRLPKHVHWVDLPKRDWVIVRNIKEFKEVVDENGIPRFISFDNDLRKEHYDNFLSNDCMNFDFDLFDDTGYNCAEYLVKVCLRQGVEIPDFECHSMNPVGRSAIRNYLHSCKKVINGSLDRLELTEKENKV